MRRKLMDPLASGVLLSFIGATPAFAEKPQTIQETLVSELEADFIRRISEPGAFAKRVDQECRPTFPEGDLFPYTLTAMAFCQRATETDDHRKKAKLLNLTETLLSLAAKSVAKKLTVKPTELSRIPTYQNHGTYVGQMGLALGFY